ncbi:hypothetical protein [Streptomyces sp. NPDC047123]|uniref:hypothetical protein n=1 Tax=Streptomyces sp. NPDC047123 TaxID=3155622 RepID=UPI003400B8EE
MSAEVSLAGDTGGTGPRLARPVTGADAVARLLGTAFPAMADIGATCEPCEINSRPGAVFRDRDARVIHTLELDTRDGRIRTIRLVSNPAKLGHLGPVADIWAIDRATRQALRS